MKIGGHPLHPMLVHLPLACWVLSVAAGLSFRLAGWPSPNTAATLNALGCILALPAMAAGLLELTSWQGTAEVVWSTVYRHMGLISVAWTLFASSLLLEWSGIGWNFRLGWMDLVLSTGGLTFLTAGAWQGGELVYRHGIGVVAARKRPTEHP